MRNLKMLFLTMIVAVLVSCNPKYYSPNTQNVPLISDKGETNLTLAGNGNQVEFQGAYGVSSNFALQANGGLFIPSDLDNGNGGSGKFLEVGAGYFSKVSENWVFETYGLLGVGTFENHLPAATTGAKGDISANIFRIGLQPNIGYKTKNFSTALSTRIVNLSYNKVEGDLVFEGENQISYLDKNSSNLLLEPALTVRGGTEKVKLQVQFGYSLNLSNSAFRQDETFLTMGLNFNFK